MAFDRARHLEDAARLLADRQKRDRSRDPLLPPSFDDPEACRQPVEAALDTPGAGGVVAEDRGEIVGFAVMSTLLFPPTHYMANFFPPRTATIGYAAHAAKAGSEYDTYRAIYAVLAEEFVARGYFDHFVYVAASDLETREAWASLCFGRDLTAAVRGLDPPQREAGAIEVHQASAEDREVIFALGDELNLHHARAPIFFPLIREAEHSARQFSQELLENADANAHWVAYQDGRAVGLNSFMPPFWISPLTAPEKTVYLYQGIVSEQARAGGVGTAILAKGVEWARDQGYEHVALHFASANLPGANFWQSSGFQPVEHRMRRRIDERIAWANTI